MSCGKAWQNFFNKAQKDWGKPKFKSKRAPKQGFKSDQAKIVGDKVKLEKPQGLKEDWTTIEMSEAPLPYPTGTMSFYRINDRYYVAIPYKIPKDRLEAKKKTGKATGESDGHSQTKSRGEKEWLKKLKISNGS